MKALVNFFFFNREAAEVFHSRIIKRREFFINPHVSSLSISLRKSESQGSIWQSHCPGIWAIGKGLGKWVRKGMVLSTNKTCILVLLFTSWVTQGKLFNLSEPHSADIKCLCEPGNVLGTEDKINSTKAYSPCLYRAHILEGE